MMMHEMLADPTLRPPRLWFTDNAAVYAACEAAGYVEVARTYGGPRVAVPAGEPVYKLGFSTIWMAYRPDAGLPSPPP